MNDTRPSGHPLHIALFDDTASTCGIAMSHLALIGDSYRFKALVRVVPYAQRRSIIRRKLTRGGII